MPQPDKEELYFLIEEYMKPKIMKWGLNQENPATCKIGITFNKVAKTRAKEKRGIILELVKDIYNAQLTENWINLLYRIENYIDQQHKDYKQGYSNYMNSSQEIIHCLFKLKFGILRNLCQKDTPEEAIVEITKKSKQTELDTYKKRREEIETNSGYLSIFKSSKEYTEIKKLIREANSKINALTDNQKFQCILPNFMIGNIEVTVGDSDYSYDEKFPITAKFIDHSASKQEHKTEARFY